MRTINENMTEEIFDQDPYVFEFEGAVVSVNGNEVILDSTAFYPGGGGQVCDTGTISGKNVIEVFRKNDDIVHIIPGHDLKVGSLVWGSVDWNRRYDLMKGHTAEHLLFGSLKKNFPELGIVKIFISPESKYVVVDKDVSWETIREAVKRVNGVIADNVSIRKSTMERDDPELENVRVDLDKVKTNEITVIEIGDADAAACSGIHVMETDELGAICVDRKVSAGKDGFAIHFRIGWDAINTSAELGSKCVEVSEKLGSKPEDILNTADNMKDQTESLRKSVKVLITSALKAMPSESVNGVNVYLGSFPAADGKIFMDACEQYRVAGSVAIMISSGTSSSVFISSGSPKVDCGAILKTALVKYEGRGGGKKEFAQGGIPDSKSADALLKDLFESVKKALS